MAMGSKPWAGHMTPLKNLLGRSVTDHNFWDTNIGSS